jgi:N-acetylglutamate synthase and related acetyltransferases
VLVAELDGDVVGVATCHIYPALHRTEPVAWLTSLVTAGHARGRGVGGTLVSSIERWAAERGATRLSLTSATHRTDAHGFYERRGYERTGVRLTHALG